MLMKEREIETETLVASLNEELKKSMSKLSEIEEKGCVKSERLREKKDIGREMSSEYKPALSQALSLGVVEGGYCERKRKAKIIKKKPIVPLVGDMFFKKREIRMMTMRLSKMFTCYFLDICFCNFVFCMLGLYKY